MINCDGIGRAVVVLARHAILGMLLCILELSAVEAQSQSVSVSDRVSCQSCKVVLGSRIQLVGTDLPIGGPPTAVEVDRAGRTWVAYPGELTKIYSAAGRFLQDLGRKGGGPSEFSGPYGVYALPGDSMLVFDEIGNRGYVVNSKLAVVRTIRLQTLILSFFPIVWPSQVAMSGLILTPASAGWPLHLATFVGAEVVQTHSFGLEQGALRPNAPMDQAQKLAAARAGFWSADVFRYRVSRWSRDGRLEVSMQRKPSWFSQASSDWIGNPTTPPPPKVVGIYEAPDGLLWVYVQVPARSWKEAWPTTTQGAKEVSTRKIRFDKLYSTIVEIVDPKSQAVVAHQALSDHVVSVLVDGRLALYSVSEDDDPQIAISRARLLR